MVRPLLPLLTLCAATACEPIDCGPLADEGPRADRFAELAPGEGAVLLLGDVLLSDGAEDTLARCGDDWPLSAVGPLIESAGAAAVVINHEGPITSLETQSGPNTTWNYGARPETATALAEAGVTHASLANNHARDRGGVGLLDTLVHLDDADIQAFGAGLAADAAIAPTVEAGGATLALVGAMHPWSHYVSIGATDERMGVLLIGPESEAALAAADADVTVFFPHWGDTYADVDAVQEAEADDALAAGADLVAGHHSHAAQPFGRVDGAPVLWSLGNAAFGSRGRFGEEQGYGLLARLVLAGGELDRVELAPVRVNNRIVGFRTEPCTLDEAEEVLEGLAEVEVVIEEGIAILEL